MADKVAMTWCVFKAVVWVLLSTYALGAVPDGLVYTEMQKTLVIGSQGVLTCRFYGRPWAVYWSKGKFDPLNPYSSIVWNDGAISGPRYDDGSYDIDDEFSLILKNVSAIDAGRVFCTVSNYEGHLIDNYTDVLVTITALETKLRVTLQMRVASYGILQCTVHIKARRVSWTKITSSSANQSLVVVESYQGYTEVNGTGYNQGNYDITQDYSLVIGEVGVHHEGLYVCEVTDFDTGISFKDKTFVTVIAQPFAPFPTIQECDSTDHDSTNEYCTLAAESEMTLTCEANGYYPALHIYFLYGSRQVEPLQATEFNNTDGTRNKTVTIGARGSKELYICKASNIPGNYSDQSTTVLLHDEPKAKPTALIIIMILLALIFFSAICFFIWRKRIKRTSTRYSSVLQEMKDSRGSSGSYEMKGVKDLTDEELQILDQRVGEVMLKHYEKIYRAVETNKIKDDNKDEMIRYIKTSLFDSDRMITDWKQRETSTLSQYSLAVDLRAANDTGYAWPSDEELKSIAGNLNQELLKTICKKLKIDIDSKPNNAIDENKIVDCLLKWRNKTAHKNFEEKQNQLSSAMGSVELKGLIPVLKGRYVYKAELVEMAFQLLIQDLLPVAAALEIPFTKLVSYRPEYHPSQLEMGTINLLSKLLFRIKEDASNEESDCLKMLGDRRDIFCKKLGDVQYRTVGTLGMCVHDMSYGELFRIAALALATKDGSYHVNESDCQGDMATPASENEQSEKIGHSCTPSTSSLLEETEKRETENTSLTDGSSGMPNENIMNKPMSGELITLQRILQLTDEDMPISDLGSSITTFTLLKKWKEKPRPSVFNYRAALAYELRQNKMSRLADQVLEGKYIKEETSHEFIQNVVESLTRDQLKNLGNLLKFSKGNWHTETPLGDITKQICDWVAYWTKKMKGDSSTFFKGLQKLKNDVIDVTRYTPKSKEHRDLNDKLVDNGFLALAREVMIIEQQLAWM